ncbi:hypothetical protein ACFQZV_11155 [Microbacterium koreense]|uniref:Secreted protein n=1 Tax=Microbacterium koreense TaxID=323761 RepID=A0ABW2ZT61_9MICO
MRFATAVPAAMTAGILALFGASTTAHSAVQTSPAHASATMNQASVNSDTVPDDGYFDITCTPWAGIDLQGAPTARGETHCVVPVDTTIGVTTILYVDGWNVGSAYNECTLNEITPVCAGVPVIRDVSGSTFCARTLVSFQLPDGWRHVATSSGTGCPV